MRIISGQFKGKIISPPSNLPSRPTTDFAKTGLFNIINNYYHFESLKVLDLYGGTGNISLEFISRGAKTVTYVEKNYNCLRFIKTETEKLKIDNFIAIKSDVQSFLKSIGEKFDLIFADPPYDTEDAADVVKKVFDLNLLNENGMLIVEHSNRQNLNELSNHKDTRKYGNVCFSFFYSFQI